MVSSIRRRQRWVAGGQPAAEGDAVGLVVEALRIQRVERGQLAVLQDLGVQLRHAVDGVAEVDVQVGHVHPALAVDDVGEGIGAGGLRPGVQPPYDGHRLRRDLLQRLGGPGLQRLGQYGVVGVAAGPGDDVHRLVLPHAPLLQQPDQLRDHQAGMGVVDLYGGVVGQLPGAAAPGLALLQDQPGGVGAHEVLLVHPQQPSLGGAVVGIQEQRQAAGRVPGIEVDAGLDQPLVHGIRVEQPQPAAPAAVAGDVDLVHRGAQLHAAHVDVVVPAGVPQPALRAPAQPVVRRLGLPVAGQALAEQPAVVGQADAVGRQAQRGQAVQEAGGQAPQAAVAQGGLRLELLQLRQRKARPGQLRRRGVVEPQVDQVVAQQLADQKLGGDVVQLPLALVVALRPRGVGGIAHQRVEQLQPGAVLQGLPGEIPYRGLFHVQIPPVAR